MNIERCWKLACHVVFEKTGSLNRRLDLHPYNREVCTYCLLTFFIEVSFYLFSSREHFLFDLTECWSVCHLERVACNMRPSSSFSGIIFSDLVAVIPRILSLTLSTPGASLKYVCGQMSILLSFSLDRSNSYESVHVLPFLLLSLFLFYCYYFFHF